MKLPVLPTMALLGSFATLTWGLYPFLWATIPVEADRHSTEKVVIPDDRVDCSASSASTAIIETSSGIPDAAIPDTLTNLALKVNRLEKGREFLNSISGYTTEFHKQEVVRGELLEEQVIAMKCRHQPFSVYLVWLQGDIGREVIYVQGKNQGKMIAHDGGWKARIPAFHLSTDSLLAMRDARYPVTTAGIGGLIEIMCDVHQRDLTIPNVESCDLDSNQEFEGRVCDVFTTNYQSAALSPQYRKSVTWIDREWNIPLSTQHFEWPSALVAATSEKLDDATVIESYSFTKIVFGVELTDLDFAPTNDAYRFR